MVRPYRDFYIHAMRKLLCLVATALLLLSCVTDKTFEADWLLGTYSNPSTGAVETWTLDADGTYRGNAYKDASMSLYSLTESMRIGEEDGDWFVYVSQPGDPEPTAFEVSEVTPTSFTAINSQNDFPTHITYKSMGNGKIYAQISNDGDQAVDFNFEPLEIRPAFDE